MPGPQKSDRSVDWGFEAEGRFLTELQTWPLKRNWPLHSIGGELQPYNFKEILVR